jgi:hypothetical protein
MTKKQMFIRAIVEANSNMHKAKQRWEKSEDRTLYLLERYLVQLDYLEELKLKLKNLKTND